MTLQQQAENLLTRCHLVENLTQYGETHIVGNVALETTTKPDIDIQIYAKGHYEDVAKEIVNLLTELGFTDIIERRLKKSKKYLILAKYLSDDIHWDFDITMTQPNENYLKDSYRFYQDYKQKLTKENRDLIIKFKQQFAHDKVSGDNASFYIYLGVLDKSIKTSENMREYLSCKHQSSR